MGRAQDSELRVLILPPLLVHYLDLPLQHISDSILKRMNRRGTKAEICDVIRRFRKLFPDCIVRTSFIVGFPGETEEDYQELYDFVQESEKFRIL